MRYTFVKQHDVTDCAAACLAMVCLHYKKETTITKLRDMMGTDLKGTNLIGLSKCADDLGFASQAVRVDKDITKARIHAENIYKEKKKKTSTSCQNNITKLTQILEEYSGLQSLVY